MQANNRDISEEQAKPMYSPNSDDPELSRENLNRLIETMNEWSMKHPYTPAETAAWRLFWFGKTPEDDARSHEEYLLRLDDEQRRGFDRYAPVDRQPFIDWPNGQGMYD